MRENQTIIYLVSVAWCVTNVMVWVLSQAKYWTAVLAFIKISFPTTCFGVWSAIFIWHLKEYTGRFIMFSMITNIYNKKTKGPTLMELLTATGKLKKFFLKLEMFDVCTTVNTSHIDMIFKFLSHASTWVHRCSSLLQWCVPLGQQGHVGGSFVYFARNACCTVTTDLLVWYSNTQNAFSPGAAIF